LFFSGTTGRTDAVVGAVVIVVAEEGDGRVGGGEGSPARRISLFSENLFFMRARKSASQRKYADWGLLGRFASFPVYAAI